MKSSARRTTLIADLCHAVGADAYLSGSGDGREYADADELAAQGIELAFDEYEPPGYPQLWDGPFEPGLSVLDPLFNCGPDRCRALLDETSPSA